MGDVTERDASCMNAKPWLLLAVSLLLSACQHSGGILRTSSVSESELKDVSLESRPTMRSDWTRYNVAMRYH
jgi:hypothetical protein